jgi:hypothetical protein
MTAAAEQARTVFVVRCPPSARGTAIARPWLVMVSSELQPTEALAEARRAIAEMMNDDPDKYIFEFISLTP